ncbi:MAG: hypothetical protein Q4G34_04395 [Micrococcus sp.]|nr:hypothetical protein [Micrococcus sp.]
MGVFTTSTLHSISQTVDGQSEAINAWDVAVPVVGNMQLVAVVVAVMWVPSVALTHRELDREEVVSRWGSWRRGVGNVLLVDLKRAAAGVAIATTAVVVTSAPLGLSSAWSERTESILRHGGLDTEVSASVAAMAGLSPWVSLLLAAAWAVCGLMAYAVMHLVVVLWKGPRMGAAVLAAAALLAMLTSSGIFGFRPFFDLTGWTNLLWAVTGQSGIVSVLLGWLIPAGGLCLVVLLRDRQVLPPALRRTLPMLSLTAAMLLVTVYSSRAVVNEGQSIDFVGVAFAGQYGALEGYIVALSPVTVAAAWGVQRLSHASALGLSIVVLRHGSSLRWMLVEIARTASSVLASAAVTLAAVAFLTTLAAPQGHALRSVFDWVTLLAGYAGVGVLMYMSALVLLWWRGGLDAWPVAVLIAVIAGYPFLVRPYPSNPLAAFSIEPGTLASGPPGVQWILILVLILAMAVVVRQWPTPRYT